MSLSDQCTCTPLCVRHQSSQMNTQRAKLYPTNKIRLQASPTQLNEWHQASLQSEELCSIVRRLPKFQCSTYVPNTQCNALCLHHIYTQLQRHMQTGTVHTYLLIIMCVHQELHIYNEFYPHLVMNKVVIPSSFSWQWRWGDKKNI